MNVVQRKQQNPLYKKLPMDMDFDTFLIGLYLMIDEWLHSDGKRYLPTNYVPKVFCRTFGTLLPSPVYRI
jgi:hypothetical protein